MTQPPRRPKPKSGPRSARRTTPEPRGGIGGPIRADADRPVRSDGTLWLYGRHPVAAALANPHRRVLDYLTLETAGDPAAMIGGPDPVVVDRATLEAALPPGAVHQGVAVRVKPLPSPGLEEIAAAPGPGLIAMLDQVSDPHNVGAILRSAAAFGVRGVIVQDRHSPEETGVLAKSACGALERVPLVRVANLSRALEDLRTFGFWSAGLEARAPLTLAGSSLGPRRVVVLGSEGAGLRRLVRDHCDVLVNIPMAGDMESLNVSNAAAIAFYELTRSASF